MADMKKSMIGLVILLAIGLALFSVITSLIGTYIEKDAITGAPVTEGMTNATCALLNIVPLLVIVGFVAAAAGVIYIGQSKGGN